MENEKDLYGSRLATYAPIVAMRGGIGLGTMKSKVMRDRLQYMKRKKEGQWGTRTSAPKTSGEDGGGEEFSAWGSGGNPEKICAEENEG